LVQGYWFCRGLKFAYPHRNWRSPLTLPELPFRLWSYIIYKNLAIANRWRVSCAHNTLRDLFSELKVYVGCILRRYKRNAHQYSADRKHSVFTNDRLWSQHVQVDYPRSVDDNGRSVRGYYSVNSVTCWRNRSRGRSSYRPDSHLHLILLALVILLLSLYPTSPRRQPARLWSPVYVTSSLRL